MGVRRATRTKPRLHKEPLEFENVHLATAELQVSIDTSEAPVPGNGAAGAHGGPRMRIKVRVWRQAGPTRTGRLP